MIYLDNGATTFPKPNQVGEKMIEFMNTSCANPGRSGHKMAQETNKEIFLARMNLAKLMNISNPMEIAFTKNASEALNIAILGFLKKGDHVITSCMEHNSVLRPLHYLQEIGEITLDIVDSDEEGFVFSQDIMKFINSNTRLIAITHASNLTGSINDLKDIGQEIEKANKNRENKICFLVDGAQTAGIIPIDVEKFKIDLLAGAGHKSLYGPTGTGFLYVRETIKLRPLYRGGTGSISESLEQPDFMPDSLETGTLNAVGIVGLKAGIDYINKVGIENIKAHCEKLIIQLIQGMQTIEGIKIYGSLDGTKRVGSVVVNLGNMDSQEVIYILDTEYDIATRGGKHCAPLAHKRMGTLDQGMVRLSVSSFTTGKEIDSAIKAIREICKQNG